MIYTFSESDGELFDAPLDQSSVDFRTDLEKRFPIIQQHNQQSADLALATRMAREAINIAGGLVEVYEKTENADADDVWDEDPDPTYFAAVQFKAFYSPKPAELAMKKSGPDAPVSTEIIFSAADLMDHFGPRMLRTGDVIKVFYHNLTTVKPEYFSIINATQTGNYRYNWVYFTCVCESTHADITVLPSADKDQQVADYGPQQ